jgi:hypothetical protein
MRETVFHSCAVCVILPGSSPVGGFDISVRREDEESDRCNG